MKNFKIIFFVFLNVAAIAGIAYVGYYLSNTQLDTEDVSASSESGLYPQLVVDTGANYEVNDEFEVGIHAQLRSGEYASAAEIVVEFDPTYLEAISIQEEGGDYLGLYKNLDNTNGRATIDVAVVGQGEFADLDRLARVEFRVKSKSTPVTPVAISNASTLGVPDISTAGGYGSVDIPLSVPQNNGLELQNSGTTPAIGYNLEDTVSVEVVADITGSYPIDRAEVITSYDHTRLEYTGFTPETGLSVEYDGPDAGNGKIYIDFASTNVSNVTDNQVLFQLNFRVIQLGAQNTNISIDPLSTLGTPNTLSTNKLGVYSVPLLFAYCGDGVVQTPNASGVNEVCDDGNTVNADQCSANCQNACTAPAVWDGQKCTTPREPFNGTEVSLPGLINAAEFDWGDNGTAYFDSTPGNSGLNEDFRGETDADIANINYTDGNATGITDFTTNEWLEYTVNVTAPGVYTFQMRAAAMGANFDDYAEVTMYIDGVDVGEFYLNSPEYGEATTTIDGNPTKVFTQDMPRSYLANVDVTAGEHVIRLEQTSGPSVNLLSVQMADLPAGCSGDYTGDGTVDVADLIVFAQNYNQAAIQCRYDLLGENCYLDIVDLQVFATNYKQPNACLL